MIEPKVKGWKGDSLDFTMSYGLTLGEKHQDRTAQMRWDPATDKMEVLGDTVDGIRRME